MIKLQKEEEPDVLKKNKGQWTKDLMALVKRYGSYENIPKIVKEPAIKNYSHPDVVKALIGSKGKAKCIYCESFVNVTGYANIEHYHPKSLFPQETFEWDNLFVGCTLCNTPKNNYNTKAEPFIHPAQDNPEDYLTFDELLYVPKHSSGLAYLKAKNVIEKCDLKRVPLVREHAEILCSFLVNKDELAKKVEEYNVHKLESKKLKDAASILSSLTVLNLEAEDGAEYAAYMRYLIRKFDVISVAVSIINSHKDELGLPDGFKWSFVF